MYSRIEACVSKYEVHVLILLHCSSICTCSTYINMLTHKNGNAGGMRHLNLSGVHPGHVLWSIVGYAKQSFFIVPPFFVV